MSFVLKVFGGVTLGGVVAGPAMQRHRLAILALLADAYPRPVTRDKLIAWLWPERDTERGRGLLNQAVYALRQALGPEAVLSSGDELMLNPAEVEVDLIVFRRALVEGAYEQAVALYQGPFLDGFFLAEAPEFGRWVDQERERLAGGFARALEQLAESAEAAGDVGKAVEWWTTLAAHDPYDSRIALGLMQALERAGNRAGALQQALAHAERLREELGIEPAAEVLGAVERLRRERVVPLAPRPKGAGSAGQLASTETAPDVTASRDVPGIAEPPRRRPIPAWYVSLLALAAVTVVLGIRLLTGRGAADSVATPAVVDEIARAVARQLALREQADTLHPAPQYRTRSIPAYDLFVRASDPALLRSDSTARLGLQYFQQALALDSNYAAAWAGLARMTLRVAGNGPAAKAEARDRAEIAARRALALDDSLAEAHAMLAVMRAQVYDLSAAESHLRRAIALEPTRARHREWLANLYLFQGRPGDALAEAEQALQAEPLSPSATAEVARALLANDRCADALARLDGISKLNPPLLRVPLLAATCHDREGRHAEAIALLETTAKRDPRTLPLLGYLLVHAGRRAEALAIQQKLNEAWREGQIGAIDLAYVPAALGDMDQAFVWVERGVRDYSLTAFPAWVAGIEGPPFRDLRRDPRFEQVLARVGVQKR